MGQQQLLLLILGVIIVGIAIAVGIGQFGASSAESNKDGVTMSLVNIAANAYQFKVRPSTLGGGSNTYNGGSGYSIPPKMRADENGTYTVSGTPSATQIAFQGTSSMNTQWTATCTADDTGKTVMTYTGW